MINYIIQVLLFQTVFLAVYDLVLKKETFFQWNRAYLIISSVLAYVIPLIRFTGVSENIPQEYRIMLPEVMLSPETYIEKQVESSATLFSGIQWVFIIGVVIAGLLFATKLFQIFKLIHQNSKEKNKDYNLVLLPTQHTAFSFFNYIFLGNTSKQKKEIIKHELIHVRQKHSLDLLLFEIQKIIFWFNPFGYVFQNRIAEVHEFIADSKSVIKKDKSTYFQNMLAEVFQVKIFAFVSSFHKQSFIKKRIMMLGRRSSKEILKFRYLWLIPILIGMLMYSSYEYNKNDKTTEINKSKLEKYSMNINSNEVIPNLRNAKKYEALRKFLDENPNYLVWIDIDENGNQFIEVHNEDEIPPNGFIRTSSKFNKGGSNINMYFNLKKYNKSKSKQS